MSRMLAFTIVLMPVSTFVLLEVANAAGLRSKRLAPREYELHEGNCTGEKLIDDVILLEATPRVTKYFRSGWRNLKKGFSITCINVENNMNRSDGASLRIWSGGLGESEVVLDIASKNGKEINFHIVIYGEQDQEFTAESSTVFL